MNEQSISERLGYRFRDPSLLERALTHSSYGYEARQENGEDNERLEFLGDAILDAVVSSHLYHTLPDCEEGLLTKYRSLIVREASLADTGRRLSLDRAIRLGRGEQRTEGSLKESIVADALEAVIAAVYLDGGFSAAEDLVLRIFAPVIRDALAGQVRPDYKTQVQELLQANGPVDIRYQLDGEEGPDHAKWFTASLWVNGEKRGEGSGRTKKEAEQHAAQAALEGPASVF